MGLSFMVIFTFVLCKYTFSATPGSSSVPSFWNFFKTQNHLTYSHIFAVVHASCFFLQESDGVDRTVAALVLQSQQYPETTQKCVDCLWRQMRWCLTAERIAAPQDWILGSQKCSCLLQYNYLLGMRMLPVPIQTKKNKNNITNTDLVIEPMCPSFFLPPLHVFL